MKKQKPLKPYGIRLEPTQRAAAAALKIDIGELFRRALDKEIIERGGKCSSCGFSLKWKK